MPSPDFLVKLQAQAKLQSTLNTTRILPRQADWLSAFIGNHPWQTVAGLATLSTLAMWLMGRI